jgi:hypothetical protein
MKKSKYSEEQINRPVPELHTCPLILGMGSDEAIKRQKGTNNETKHEKNHAYSSNHGLFVDILSFV